MAGDELLGEVRVDVRPGDVESGCPASWRKTRPSPRWSLGLGGAGVRGEGALLDFHALVLGLELPDDLVEDLRIRRASVGNVMVLPPLTPPPA